MAKSRRFQPGDSAPDFSHLAGHDEESDDAAWRPNDKEDPQASAPDEDETADLPTDEPPRRTSVGPDQLAAVVHGSAGDSHVFFDADDPVTAEELLGETRALTSESVPTPPEDAIDADSVLSAAPDFDSLQTEGEGDKSSQLTDVGIPCFEPLPGVDESDAGSDDEADERTAVAAIESGTDDSAKVNEIETPFVHPAELEEFPAAVAVDAPSAPAATANVAAETPKRRERTRARRERPTAPPPDDSDSRRLMMILLASYASAITLAFLWMWLTRSTARPHELESLPDVAPLGPNEFRYAPQSATMPRGHTLPLGTATQLGYIEVEPLRVTRGPVQYAHYSDPTQSRSSTPPVLKLWLRFTNVSSDQQIAPLDPPLLLTRSYQVESDTVLANQLLLAADRTSQKPAYVLDHPLTSEWDLAGQSLGQRLKPGESLETYIPLEPGSESHLTGDLLWRVHFRKGYHAATGNGVTTLIEVPFSTADIQTESPAPT